MVRSTDSEIVQRALIVDDDEILNHQISQLLIDHGVVQVDSSFDGESGWEMILSGDYDIVVMDWKLPALSGLALFNRIRGIDRLMAMPILVVSGLVQKIDFRLLAEFPCTRLLEKPFNHAALVREMDSLSMEAKWYELNTEKIAVITKLASSDPDAGLREVKRLVSDSPNPQPILLLAARKLREAEFFEQAIELLKMVLEKDRGNVPAISELGRCLHLLGRYEEAMHFLRRANAMSPENVGRLCLMGEVELNRADAPSAGAAFTEALKIDQENRRARKGMRVVATLAEMMHRPAGIHIKDTFASLMNTVAVNLAHSGEYSSAVEKYEEAFHFIAGREASAKVAFNVGLAYLRWGKIRESYDWFFESVKRGQGKFTKANEYVEKLEIKMKQAEEDEKRRARSAAEAAAAAAAAQQAESEKKVEPEPEKSEPAPEHEQPN